MKFSRSLLAPSLLLNAVVLPSAAGSVIYDFNSESVDDFFTDGVSGWTQSNTNPSAFGTEFPLAYISEINFGAGASNAGVLGTLRSNTADNSPTTVTGGLSFSLTDPAPPSATLDFALLNPGGANRDAFSFALSSATGTLAEVFFTPDTGDVNLWDIGYATNGGTPVTSLSSVIAGSAYELSIIFGSSETSFSYGATSTGANVQFGTGPVISEIGRLSKVSATHTPVAAAGSSINALVFDNITVTMPESSVIPEPSSALLLGMMLSLSVTVRRRSAPKSASLSSAGRGH